MKTIFISFCVIFVAILSNFLVRWFIVPINTHRVQEVTHMKDTITEKRAIFAGGCFWCMEPPFEQLKGVKKVSSGFVGGKQPNPSYKEVSSGLTEHTEAIEVTFDPQQVNYQQLLDLFWQNIDPTDSGGQFVDRGRQYRPGIFYLDNEQKSLQNLLRKICNKVGLLKTLLL